MEIPAASLDQVVAGRDGRMISVDAELCDIAKQLESIPLPSNPGTTATLRLRYAEATGVFVVYQLVTRDVDGAPVMKQLVTTWDPEKAGGLSSGLVERCRMVTSEQYDLVGEMRHLEAEERRDQDHALEERAGEQAALLHHALMKDKGVKPTIFVPRGV